MLIPDLFVKKFIQNQQQIDILCYKNLSGTHVHGGLEWGGGSGQKIIKMKVQSCRAGVPWRTCD